MPWSREDRVTDRIAEESSSISKGGSAEDSAIERMDRLLAIRAKLVDAEDEQCAVEEQLFGEPIAPGAGSRFIEKSFGSEVAPRQKRYLTSAGVSRDLSSIVVSIALFDGDNMLFACSGIPLPYGRTALRLTRFVTSARLATEYTANRNRDDNLRVKVRLPDNSITGGLLGLYDRQIAIVTTVDLPSLHDIDLNPQYRKPSCGDPILAVGRAFTSCSLMAASGHLAAHESQSRKPSMWVSDSSLSEAVVGGPVIGTGGRFLGMSLPIDDSDDFTGRNVLFLQGVILLNRLRHFGILNPKKLDFRGYSLPKDVFCASPSGFRRGINRMRSLGYPMAPPLVLEFNGKLLNRFEGYFGGLDALEGFPYDDPPFVHENHVWEQLPKEVVSDISQHVVSIKSFHDHVRYFACTGLLIWWPESSGACSVILTSASLVRGHDNEYYTDSLRSGASGVGGHDDDDHIKNLRIEVCLPQNRNVTGTLEWYNVNYNIAIVSVGNYVSASRPENIFNAVQMPSRNALPTLGRRKYPSVGGKVVAIGHNTEQRLLMASIGEVKRRNKGIKLDSIGGVKQRNKRIRLDSVGEEKQRNKRIKPGEVKQRNNGTKLDCRYLELSTCKINKAGIGGPLINFGGSFVGMNFYDGSEETPFLPRSKIVEVLKRVVGLSLPSRWPVPEPYWYHGLLELDMYHLPEFRGRTLL